MSTAVPFPNGTPSSQLQAVAANLRQLYPHISQGRFNLKEVIQITAVCGLIPGLWYLNKWRESKSTSWTSSESSVNDGMTNGSAVKIQKNVNINDPKASSLPTTPAPLPLLVFIHGLGGSVAQFHPLLTSLVNLASCLAIDLPGCGLSSFEPKDWDAYTTDALAELLSIIIDDYRERDAGQGVVLIGHSMGCSLAAKIASKTSSDISVLSDHVVGLVAVCPKAEPPTEPQVATFRKLLWIPNLMFDTWRRWDRRGGIESPSVHRFVGGNADIETKKLQERFNSQSRTAVWRRMASGSLPVYENGVPKGGLPGREVWSGLEVPVFLVAGESDNITKPIEIEKIASFLGKSHPVQIAMDEESKPIPEAATPLDYTIELGSSKITSTQIAGLEEKDFVERNPSTNTIQDAHEDPSTPNEELSEVPPQPLKPKKVLKTTIIPAPASHALLYMPSQVRILAGLISDFLCSQVSPRLSLGWQLQFLSTAGKWDVKNLAKWQAVTPVSEPIAGIFRAMKTLREVDESHCPEVFVQNWGSQIKNIVDISHESPVYDPRGLEKGGIHYHKFPTVSKIPPTGEEVTTFIALVDRLREEQKLRAEKENLHQKLYLGVHCHYGFNRTGYFIVCYLIERCGYSVQGAVDEFAKRRPKGIKHAHFLDQLFVRYCVGLKRAPTL
ncbi:Polynucleotide 5 -triphosphatase [Hyphodiscus hymeniophilus]|uniref:Polynucleotide 5 -triphosphatase n=1 Tax=Hyphodiscus hymeniophilus TaxID=353542 RepID=A0A9P6VJQ1_9HELO|nr:Polynucleotide 5 -triphosphatase [Hyphodiscus hymeniophilus]